MGAPTRNFWSKKLLFGKNFFENCMKMKENGPTGGPTCTPLDPPMLKSSNKYALEATGSKNLHPNLCSEVGWKSMRIFYLPTNFQNSWHGRSELKSVEREVVWQCQKSAANFSVISLKLITLTLLLTEEVNFFF